LLTLTTSKRYLLAMLSGAVSFFAYPSPGIWPAIFISVLGLYLSVRGLTFWRAFGVGFVGGAAYYVAQIYWISQYLGPRPLVGLAAVEALIFAVGAAFMALATKRLQRTWQLALVVAILWNSREWVATHFPYGGFPWSRVAMSQSNSPLAFWVAVGGFGLLTFVIVFVTIFTFERMTRKTPRGLQTVAAFIGIAFIVPIGIGALPITSSGSLKIAAVQGNANAGLFSNVDRGTILENHLDATDTLLASQEEFDLVVWPENASDKNPDDFPDAEALLRDLVDNKLKKPLIFGTITSSGEEFFNSSKLYLPGRGEVDQYDKKRPVPFGEYVPDREFFYQIAPDLIGMISRGYSFGTRDGIFEVSGVKTGILICFEEAIDEVPREVVEQGATVIIAQTNNADFGKSDESVQQLGIGRLRAIETGRAIVHISTVGPSAIIGPKGELIETTEAYVPDYLNAEVPLVSGKNLAMSGGWLFDPVSAVLGGLIALILIIDNRRKTTKL